MSQKTKEINIYRTYQIQASESILDPDEQSYYRKICRWYSSKFHTPLFQVLSLPVDHVLTNYYESTMEEIPYNDLIDITIQDFIPELVKEQDDTNEEYAKALEEEQALSLANKGSYKLKLPSKPQSLKKDYSDQPSKPDDVKMVFEDETEP